MEPSPTTRPSLLLRLAADDDRESWQQFVEIYAPVVFAFARRRGLQDADAADIAQEVLTRVAEQFRQRKYDPRRGSFRGWLLTLTRHEIYDWLQDRARRADPGGGTEALQHLAQITDPRDDEAVWQREFAERVFAWAAARVRSQVSPPTWAAFWQTTVEQAKGEVVAAELGMSVAAVYLAKSRVMKRLREQVAEITEENPPPALSPEEPPP